MFHPNNIFIVVLSIALCLGLLFLRSMKKRVASTKHSLEHANWIINVGLNQAGHLLVAKALLNQIKTGQAQGKSTFNELQDHLKQAGARFEDIDTNVDDYVQLLYAEMITKPAGLLPLR